MTDSNTPKPSEVPATKAGKSAREKKPRALKNAGDVYARIGGLPNRPMDGLAAELLREIREAGDGQRIALQLLSDLVFGTRKPGFARVNCSFGELLQILSKTPDPRRPDWKTPEEARSWIDDELPDHRQPVAVATWWKEQRHLPLIYAVIRHVGQPSIFFTALFELSGQLADLDENASRNLRDRGFQIARKEICQELIKRSAATEKPSPSFTATLWQILAFKEEQDRVVTDYRDSAGKVRGLEAQVNDLASQRTVLSKKCEEQEKEIEQLRRRVQELKGKLFAKEESLGLAVTHQGEAAESGKAEVLMSFRGKLLPRLEKLEIYTDRETPNKERILSLAKEMREILQQQENPPPA
jgi:hypothetical protein